MKKFLSVVLLTASVVSCFGGVVMAEKNLEDERFFGDEQIYLSIGYDDEDGYYTRYRDKGSNSPVYVRDDSDKRYDIKVLSPANFFGDKYVITQGHPYARCLPGENSITVTWNYAWNDCQLKICSGEKGECITPHGVWSPDSEIVHHIANYFD